jgi:hypothetical protein
MPKPHNREESLEREWQANEIGRSDFSHESDISVVSIGNSSAAASEEAAAISMRHTTEDRERNTLVCRRKRD